MGIFLTSVFFGLLLGAVLYYMILKQTDVKYLLGEEKSLSAWIVHAVIFFIVFSFSVLFVYSIVLFFASMKALLKAK